MKSYAFHFVFQVYLEIEEMREREVHLVTCLSFALPDDKATTVNSRYSGHPWGKVKWLD